MAKTPDLTVVKAQMELEEITGVLARVRYRIAQGDLQGAQGIVVLVLDAESMMEYDTSDSLTDEAAVALAQAAAVRFAMRFIRLEE